jgi:hypothetical protein
MVAKSQYGTQDALQDGERIVQPQSANNVATSGDEESPLLGQSRDTEPTVKTAAGVGAIVAVLLLGTELTIFHFALELIFYR